MEDQLNVGEEVEWSGAEVKYEDEKYDAFLTNERLILHNESGFLSKSENVVTWDLDDITNTNFNSLGTTGEISVKLNSGTVKLEGQLQETIEFMAKLRVRTS